MLLTCNSLLDKIISSNRKILIYGEAGSGKTNIMLNMLLCSLKINNSNIYYISTEGSTFLNRVINLGIDSDKVLFSIAIDQHHLTQLIIETMSCKNLLALFIDTINHYYRIEAVEPQNIKMFLNILTLLDMISSNSYVIASAQVKVDEHSEIVAGYEYLLMWADAVVFIKKLSNRSRVLRFIKPSINQEFKFLIIKNGIKWVTI
jgi:predicted ATP-dependent serine protease